MVWLVTGGAGYIGAHVVRALIEAGNEVVVLDDLSTGARAKVPNDVTFIEASITDFDQTRRTLEEYHVTGVVHLAAKKAVEESMARPLWYFEENVEGFRRLLSAMIETGVDELVLSSSAAVYGEPSASPVSEQAPTVPVNPYGQTKLACEWLAAATARSTELRAVALRYFNVAGAAAPELVDPGVTNLVPLVLRALAEGQPPRIFGDDYPTSDGTCVRDYIHVADVADAHVAACRTLQEGLASRVYNISRGTGSSVREVIETARRVTGIAIQAEVSGRRPGDPAEVVGDPRAIADDLGWRAQHDLTSMVWSAWVQHARAAPSDLQRNQHSDPTHGA